MPGHLDTARRVRTQLVEEVLTPTAFRAALTAIPALDRDAWVDRLLDLDGIPSDEPDLPPGCAPYLPCAVATVLDAIDQAVVTADDVFVDIGSGLGRTTALTHLLTGAGCIGLEVQPGLAREARGRSARLNLSRTCVVEGDALDLLQRITIGTVFFLYCPFSGERFARVLDVLGEMARAREIRVCCVDLPSVDRPWLVPVEPARGSLAVYRSTAHLATTP